MNMLPTTDNDAPIYKMVQAFRNFMKLEAASGILLIACTIAALAWANSPWGQSYTALWETPLTIGFKQIQLSKSLLHWINDGLMTIFFFVVGLEIKREMLIGELASAKRAALPVMAAIGGMLGPAVLYACFNAGQPSARGWGIPMATDIAFSLGVLALLGQRVPFALKILLAALAIADDLGAILVIAVFYTAKISWTGLAIAGVCGFFLFVVNRRGIQHPLVYLLLGFGLWLAMLKSGVHATISGVLVAMAVPARLTFSDPKIVNVGTGVRQWLKNLLHGVAKHPSQANPLQSVPQSASDGEKVESPLTRFEQALHPWVGFGVMPLFALANAGVTLHGELSSAFRDPVSLGIIVGLVFGKPIGIVLLSWAAVRLGVAALPGGVAWRHILGIGMLAGIGFTMSLFVAHLAFGIGPLLDTAKVGIIIASLISGLCGGLLLFTAGLRVATAVQPQPR